MILNKFYLKLKIVLIKFYFKRLRDYEIAIIKFVIFKLRNT